MDFDLIINSFPKLLFASITTLKLLSVSLFIGLFIGLFFAILRIKNNIILGKIAYGCLLYTSPSPRDLAQSRMPSSA